MSNDNVPERIWMSSTCSGWSTERESIHDIEYARVHAPTGKVSEGDRELIEAVAMPWICVEEKPCGETTAVHWEEMVTALTAALATVRREEREVERLRTLKVIQKLPATAAGADAFRKKLIEELYREAYALEASASDKGGMK